MCKIGSMVLFEILDLPIFDLQALAVLDGQDVLTCARGTNRLCAYGRFAVWSLVFCWRSFRFSTYTINALFMILVYKIWLGVTMGWSHFVCPFIFCFRNRQCAHAARIILSQARTPLNLAPTRPRDNHKDGDCRLDH